MVAVGLSVTLTGRTARAEDEVKNFRKPILMVETGGHHAPVRSMVWQNDFTLLSGGEDRSSRSGISRRARSPVDPPAALAQPRGRIYAWPFPNPTATASHFWPWEGPASKASAET